MVQIKLNRFNINLYQSKKQGKSLESTYNRIGKPQSSFEGGERVLPTVENALKANETPEN